MADPVLENKFSERGLNQAVAIASMCVQEEATTRPLISDVMVALSFLSMSTEEGVPTTVPILSFRDKSMSIALSRHDSDLASPKLAVQDEESSSSESDDGSGSNSHEEDRSSISSKPIDEKNQAQSLKINYRYSWEEVDVSDEKLSSKSSHKSNDGSVSSFYDIDGDHDDSLRNKEKKEEDHGSKTDDDQSVYFDDESGDDNGISFHRIKSGVEV